VFVFSNNFFKVIYLTYGHVAIEQKQRQPALFGHLRCWQCDYEDKAQCVKHFDFTKHTHAECDGKCLKAFEKIEARTKTEIEKAQCKDFLFLCSEFLGSWVPKYIFWFARKFNTSISKQFLSIQFYF
jgi:hypothetical protein